MADDGSIIVEEPGITFTVPAGIGITEVTAVENVGYFGGLMSAQPSSLRFTLLDDSGEERGAIQIFRYATASGDFELPQDDELEMLLDEQPSLLIYAAKNRMPQLPLSGSAAIFGGAGEYVDLGSGDGLRYITAFAQDRIIFTPET